MKSIPSQSKLLRPLLLSIPICAVTAGCGDAMLARKYYEPAPHAAPLGAISDDVWNAQENRAEASKFVVYDHEFKLRSHRLNNAGEDHVKQIASQIHAGTAFPVVVERSMNDNTQGQYKYPVNPNPELDNQRRNIIVAALQQMGVPDAERMVVVAPAFTTAATAQEAESGYLRGISSQRSNGNFGGGFGGFGGGGGLIGGITSDDSSGAGSNGAIVGGASGNGTLNVADEPTGP